MSDMALFEGNSLVSSDLFKSLQDVDDNLAGGSGGSGPRRISIRGGRFREMVGGEQVNVKSDGFINVVIVNAAKISRTYYAGQYDPENPSGPSCWSPDTQAPDPSVPSDTRQASQSAWTARRTLKGQDRGKVVPVGLVSALLSP